ncbi:hypothetical protein AOLI_G00163200 [Acnodon oligacanthus]
MKERGRGRAFELFNVVRFSRVAEQQEEAGSKDRVHVSGDRESGRPSNSLWQASSFLFHHLMVSLTPPVIMAAEQVLIRVLPSLSQHLQASKPQCQSQPFSHWHGRLGTFKLLKLPCRTFWCPVCQDEAVKAR